MRVKLLLLLAGLLAAGLWWPGDPMAEVPVAAVVVPPPPEPPPPRLPGSAFISFEGAAETGQQLLRLHSLLVSYRGKLLLERYYRGTRPHRPANVKSASKSILSALVGIAIGQGILEGVDQPIGDFFHEELSQPEEKAKRAITIGDLLSMRSGLETTSNRYYGGWVMSPNWVRHVLSRSLEQRPGGRMRYSTGNTHLLSAILTRASGTSTWRFAQDHLAMPLGFTLARWPRDPQGIYFGGNDMELTPRQMLAFGRMYLNEGRANGRQIVPAPWVAASLTPRTPSTRERGRFYGYGWWIRDMAGYQTSYAWGYGGQCIFIVPALELVVVTTSSTSTDRSRRPHLRQVFDLIERQVIGAIEGARAG